MNLLDIILIIAIVLGLWYGYKRGIISQLSFGAGIAFALLQTSTFLPAIATFVDDVTKLGATVSMVVGFILLLVVSIYAFKLLAKLLTNLLEAMSLNFINQILGAIFSAYIALLLVSTIVNVTGSYISPENSITGRTAQRESLFYKKSLETTSSIIDEVRN